MLQLHGTEGLVNPMNEKYWVSVNCSWVEEVKAATEEEAVRKTQKKYMFGNGRFPREYVEVSAERIDFCQVED